ncbi:PIG-L family deacetylase [Yinghuangia seranimata]|uniref:PIG-L family deacetylase n=1 Tax=Yinghuangia seranimata TaxID=408067 RepID=UPI00248C9D49|nr:PIG-L family deacetylase [Yinghuangia seranimata]MDI2131712.1 PIG-L family deacetylase [Yinghuangia seranimata]
MAVPDNAPSRRQVLAALAAVPLAGALASGCSDDGGGGDPPFTVPSPDPARSADKVLNVVAHHDDDLLFISPQLVRDLQSGAHVRSLYFNASDYEDYPKYMKDREEGIRQAYAMAIGADPAGWRPQPYTAAGVQATLWTLGDRLSVLETRIPDGFRKTPPGAKRLWYLYAENMPIQTRPGDTFPEQTVDRTSLVAFLRAVVEEFRPGVVNTLDPVADLHGKPDVEAGFHQDHIAVSRLVMLATERWAGAPNVVYHRDYTIDSEKDNLTKEQAAAKRALFHKYTEHDPDAAKNKAYDPWLKRMYLSDAAWWGDLVIPMPAPVDGWARPVPVIGRTYRVVNRGTGQELVLPAGGAAATRAPGADGPDNRFELRAMRRGWALAAGGAGGTACLEVAEADEKAGGPVKQNTCAVEPYQAMRLHGAADSGYLVVPARTDLALTAGGPGGAVTLQPRGDAAAQRWDFQPVG